MSLIKHLPVDILFNVFNYATPNIDRSPTRWKRSLVLLAVCREWRDVAKRVVYRYTFVRDPFSDSGQYDELHFKTIKKRRNVSDNDSDDNSYDYSDDYSSSSQSAVFGDMYDCGYDSCEDVFDVGTGTMYHIAPGRIHSNFKLVLQNGFGDLVTHISMMERRYSDEYQPHIHLLDAFGFKGIYRSVPARYSYSQMVVNNNKNRANQTISPEETDMSSRSLASEIFVRRDREPHDDQLLESINKIFHKTGNIETVLCILDLKNYNIDWDIVNWPHVTQLEVHNVERFDLMLAAIPRMQNLASLAIVFDFISARNNSIIINGLNTLREQHQPPFDSNVNSLRIVLNDQSPDHIPDIITELRHYFPTLEDVVVTAT
ncbi:hypothetical protein GGF43_000350 [Coemansia sp. RSA 2618]|nr:hypothetical protein GGF43_000350 [Coemansia sp. RSA 2618]